MLQILIWEWVHFISRKTKFQKIKDFYCSETTLNYFKDHRRSNLTWIWKKMRSSIIILKHGKSMGSMERACKIHEKHKDPEKHDCTYYLDMLIGEILFSFLNSKVNLTMVTWYIKAPYQNIIKQWYSYHSGLKFYFCRKS